MCGEDLVSFWGVECYQQPDPDTMRVALENRGTLRSVRAS